MGPAGVLLAGTRWQPAAGDGVPPSLQIPPHTHILLARSAAPYTPFRRAWQEVGRTAVVQNNLVFKKKVEMDYTFEKQQHLKFLVYDS